MTKTICFLIGNLSHSGGTERVTTMLANKLAESEDYNICILSLANSGTSFFPVNKKILINSLYRQKVSMKWNLISAIWKIRKYVLEHRIDTLIVVDSISCVFTIPALWGLNVNHICWEHFNFNVDLGVPFRRLGRRWAAKYCNHIITLTYRDVELWKHGLNKIKANIVAIPNPTPYENISSKPNQANKTVLAIGRLTYQKGFDLLLSAWLDVTKIHPQWKLQIVGNGEDEMQLKQQAHHLNIHNRVEFINATKEINHYYKNASFYCLSSRFEGFPMVLLEAQAFGLPIISFNCDTGPADLIANEINGFLVKQENILQLAKTLIKSIELSGIEYDRMVENAQFNSTKFTIKHIADQWLKII